jgi:prophage antirepressor-like protein
MNNETNAVEVFNNEEFGSVRTTIINGEPWFVAVDVCKALEIDATATRRLDEDEKSTLRLTQTSSNGTEQGRDVTAISESGLYSLVLGSRKPEAKAFKRWITHDVIPTIRKTGGYIHGADEMSNEEILSHALIIAQNVIQEKERRLKEQEPKVEFADHVAASENAIDMGEFAKIAQKNGITLGRNNLFKKLRELKILMDGNLPYQQYMNAGWFEVVESAYERSGTLYVSTKTLVTGKGQIALVRKLRKALAEESTRYIA